MHYLYLLFFIFSINTLSGVVVPTQAEGDWYINHFEFDERLPLSQMIVQLMTLEGSNSILDLDWVDGVLENDAILNLMSYQGGSPYPDAVTRSAGSANLLNPFVYFDLGVTYDWVVCIGLAGFFPAGSETVFVTSQ